MNIKKLFPEKKISKKGILEFLDKKGFYIVLILCIAIIAATAVFVTTHNITSSNTEFDNKLIPEEPTEIIAAEDKMMAQSSVNTTEPAPVQKPLQKAAEENKPAAKASKEEQPAVKNTKAVAAATKEKTPAPKTAEPAKTQKFTMPVFGPVTFEYAKDKLLYSKTLEEWRTHSGVDLGGEKGTAVKAVADGVVRQVKRDPRYGFLVEVDHNNGVKTIYANLASDDMVNPNQKVKQGDILGSIGDSANFESAEQPHLHFEVWKNNVPVNPSDYLPIK